MSPIQKMRILNEALRQIGDIAVEPGEDPMVALLDAQRIADEAREKVGLHLQAKVLPMKYRVHHLDPL